MIAEIDVSAVPAATVGDGSSSAADAGRRPAAQPSPLPPAEGYRRVWVERRSQGSGAASSSISSAGSAAVAAGRHRFSIATWNIQAAGTRGPNVHASDRSGAEECLHRLMTWRELRVPGGSGSSASASAVQAEAAAEQEAAAAAAAGHPPDIISLQELQRCPRHLKTKDCRECLAYAKAQQQQEASAKAAHAGVEGGSGGHIRFGSRSAAAPPPPPRVSCKYDHAGWLKERLKEHGALHLYASYIVRKRLLDLRTTGNL